MKQTTKKILLISLAVSLFASLTIWYFFPMLKGQMFIYTRGSLKGYLNVHPTYIKELPKPPATWDNISIDALVVKLPISKFNKISGREDYISFASDQGVLDFVSLVPSKELLKTLKERNLKYPLLSFQEKLMVLKVLPGDLSFFNSRDRNKEITANLINKASLFAPDHFGELFIVSTDMLKAICLISENGKNGYNAVVDLYSPNEAAFVEMALFWYKERTALKSDLLSILGGLTMPNQPLQAERVKDGISAIVNKFSKTKKERSS